jgi:hypothetical protein
LERRLKMDNIYIVYIVIIEDRHIDVAAYPFSERDMAISEARRIAKESCDYEEDYEEQEYPDDPTWELSITYSCEGDCVSVNVISREINSPITG